MERASRAAAWFGAGMAILGLGAVLLLSSPVPTWLAPFGWVLLFIGTMSLGISAHIGLDRGAATVTRIDIPSAPPTPTLTENMPTLRDRADDDNRDFLGADITPKYLNSFFKEHTGLQANSLAAPFIGKWIALSGTVDNVFENHLELSEFTLVLEQGQIIFAFDKDWASRFAVLRRGAKVTIHGQMSMINRLGITLAHCEIVT